MVRERRARGTARSGSIAVRDAVPGDADFLSELAMRSKAHWGYSRSFMEACRQELSVDPARILDEACLYRVAVEDESIVGFYALERVSDSDFELDALFVEPACIGRGIGRLMVADAAAAAVEKSARRIIIQGDPNAEDFYLAVGASRAGMRESRSVPGRFLPVFEIVLGEPQQGAIPRCLYAAYGSNLHPARLSARIPGARFVATRFLEGWTLCFHKRGKDGSGKCSIAPGGSGVHVAIYEISDEDKRILDRIEGVGAGYRDEALMIEGLGHCITYVAEADHVDESLRPYDWYRDLVLLGAAVHGFPGPYLDRIRAVPTVADPDPERASEQSALVARIRDGD